MTTAVQPFTGTYNADPVHSTFGFAVNYAGTGKFRGTLGDVSASLDAGDDGLALEGAARVESISIQDPAQFRAHVLGPDFFDTENHPEVTFRSSRIELDEDGTARLDGELTIAGITRPVAIAGTWAEPVAAAGGGLRTGLELATVIDRRDFGFEWQMQLPSGGDALGYEVTLDVSLALVQPEA
ncbi:MAG: YceI family protein [Thermoleophilaceae bacterium]|nr:YceI family protein [Thermoleophilaceae bacterium]